MTKKTVRRIRAVFAFSRTEKRPRAGAEHVMIASPPQLARLDAGSSAGMISDGVRLGKNCMETLAAFDWAALACWLGAFVLIALGFAGTIVPAIPGLPMIAGGAWLIGWADDFEKVGWKTIVFLAVLAAIGVVVDTVAQTAGAQKAGASKAGIIGSLVGTVLGMFMGLFGLLFMPLIGAAVGEFYAKRNLMHAGRVGLATWIGMIVGTAVKVALAFAMTGILIFVYLTA